MVEVAILVLHSRPALAWYWIPFYRCAFSANTNTRGCCTHRTIIRCTITQNWLPFDNNLNNWELLTWTEWKKIKSENLKAWQNYMHEWNAPFLCSDILSKKVICLPLQHFISNVTYCLLATNIKFKFFYCIDISSSLISSHNCSNHWIRMWRRLLEILEKETGDKKTLPNKGWIFPFNCQRH